jgi:hypothetical protein
MDIDAPHTRTPGTLPECSADPTVNDLTASSSAISADPATKVHKLRSKVVDQPTPAPVRFSAHLAEKMGHTIDDPQPSVHTIFAVDLVDANPDPANIDALARWGHARWRLACHDELTKDGLI